MWKLSLVLLVCANAVITKDLPQNETASSIIPAKNNSTQQQQADKNSTTNALLISTNEISNKSVNSNEKTSISYGNDMLNHFEPNGDLDDFNFKYYWILLVGSSLAIIGLIVFRSFRLRRSRAEVRYGRPTDSEEIEPFSKSKWDNDESSENEDEIFDINFLKNTRLQTHNDL